MAALPSGMAPCGKAVPGGTSSSPVEITATRGRRKTGTLAWPAAVSTPISREVSTVPAS